MNQLLLISKLMEKYVVLLMHERGMEFGWRPQVDVGKGRRDSPAPIWVSLKITLVWSCILSSCSVGGL